MSSTPTTPAPPIVRDDASADFFDGTARGELLLRRCPRCGRIAAPQARQCPECAGTEFEPVPASGSATLVSWAVPRDREGRALTVAALVELAEGPWLRLRLIGAEPETLSTGLPLAVSFEAVEGSETVPVVAVSREGSAS
jgi:hypothetical protein